MKPQTGEPVWNLVIAKRGLNTGVGVERQLRHRVARRRESRRQRNGHARRLRRHRQGQARQGQHQVGGQGIHRRILLAGDRWRPHLPGRQRRATCSPSMSRPAASSGSRIWAPCRRRRRCSRDGKIYVGTESGKFFILRPHADRCEVLSEVEMPISDTGPVNRKRFRSRSWPRRGRARPRLFRFERHALRHRSEEDARPSRGSR